MKYEDRYTEDGHRLNHRDSRYTMARTKQQLAEHQISRAIVLLMSLKQIEDLTKSIEEELRTIQYG